MDHWIFFLQKPVRFYNVWLELPVIVVNVLITMLDNSLLVSWEGQVIVEFILIISKGFLDRFKCSSPLRIHAFYYITRQMPNY